MRAKIIPYKMGSRGATALADALGIRKVRHNSDTYRHRQGTVLVNWGNTNPVTFNHDANDLLNPPENVRNASNKLTAFDLFRRGEVPTVEWTTSREQALTWVDDGATVFARTSLAGHSGEGIVVMSPDNDENDVNAPLYTKYKKKANEYRVHIFGGTEIAIQEKKRANDAEIEGDAALIRSHQHGWNFCRDNLSIRTREMGLQLHRLIEVAEQAISALGLDFGAVDIIYNSRDDQFYVLEVNTAVGLEGQTLTDYVNAITDYVANH
jgi:glutathione synthase/RimK-type ligase-like ATP-grasp enzyme